MAQELVQKSRYMRIQSYGDSVGVLIAKPFAEQLQIEKGSTVRTWTENGIFHAKRAE